MTGEISQAMAAWREEGTEVVLTTLIRVFGSAPRPPGARLCCTADGRMVGSVSGGCVESDVIERARGVLADGRPVLVEYGIADALGLQVGLACGGRIEVLIERFAPDAAWEAVCVAEATRQPVVLAIAVEPAVARGRRLAIVHDGSVVGSVDPAVDARIESSARQMLARGGTGVLDFPAEHGSFSVFVEAVAPPPRLYIVGATHVATHLCRMAYELGFHVTVVDARSVFATVDRFPQADVVRVEWPERILDEAQLDVASCVATLTHDPKFDIPALSAALRSEAGYIGAMGSRATHAQRCEQLRAAGFGEADLARIHAPIGLDLGGCTPRETALSILAEIVAVRHLAGGTYLKNCHGAIHVAR